MKNKKPYKYWTFERCKEEALKYTYSSDFSKSSPSAYRACNRNKWMTEINSHFESDGSTLLRYIYAYEFPDNKVYVGLTYNIEKRKTNHRREGAVYEYCIKTNLVPVFKQLILKPVDVEEAKKLEDYYLNQYISNEWIPLNTAKPGGLGGNIIKWSFKNCSLEALKYETRGEYRKKSSQSYKAASKNRWLDSICNHMKVLRKPKISD